MTEEKGRYNDIINFPHHVSAKHPQMSRMARAAQFAPFSAVAGHEAAIYETARLTDTKIEFDENKMEVLNRKLNDILFKKSEKPMVLITYFKADGRKTGGKYITVKGIIEKFDDYRKEIILENKMHIPINDLYDIKDAT